MTRHNLPIHISWLLQNKVTPPVGAGEHLSVSQGAQVLDGIEETPRPGTLQRRPQSESPVEIQSVAPTVNVVQEFARPTLPSSVASSFSSRHPPPVQEAAIPSTIDSSMGRLASASKSKRPSLLVGPPRQQLGTPASTSTTSSSSLMNNYAAQLRTSGTPGALARNQNLDATLARSFPTPRSTRQTPTRTPRFKPEEYESVDLTADDDFERPTSKSSSSIDAWGEATLLWSEGAAARPEPQTPRGRKRKSDEIARSSPTRKEANGRASKQIVKDRNRDSVEGFVDIDDMDIFENPPTQKTPKPRGGSIAASVEVVAPVNDFSEEEYSVTETVSRVETRVRKSVSRVPSGEEAKIPASDRATTSTFSANKASAQIQVHASPRRERTSSPASSRSSQPQQHDYRQTRVVEDSDDAEEDIIECEEMQATCSPHILVKDSPRVRNSAKLPRLKEGPLFEADEQHNRDSLKVKVQSPLRQISQNVNNFKQQDSSPSPRKSPEKRTDALKISLSPRKSPEKRSEARQVSQRPLSQRTPSSTLSVDEQELVKTFVKNPSTVAAYRKGVEHRLSENSIKTMAYHDNGERAPSELVEERKGLLDMRKAYDNLKLEWQKYSEVAEEKKVLAHKMFNGQDEDGDAEIAAAKSKELRQLEITISQLLEASGAISEGLGSESTKHLEQPYQNRTAEALSYSISDSSLNVSRAVIQQTQLPSRSQSVTGSSRDYNQTSIPRRDDGSNSAKVPRNRSPDRPSAQKHVARHQYQSPALSEWPMQNAGAKPSEFHRSNSPMDFDVNDDYFDDMLEDEFEIQNANQANQKSQPADSDEEYGDFGDDNDIFELMDQQSSVSLPPQGAVQRRNISATTAYSSEAQQRSKAASHHDMYAHVDSDNNKMKYPWWKDVKKALKDRFKLKGFRLNQADAINNTLAGNHTFVLMPTGGGKSLCYQLPAVILTGKTKGVTIVISPLLSLMSDQVSHLNRLNITAEFLNGDVTPDERRLIHNVLQENCPEQFIQLLYITPEMINKSHALLAALSKMHQKKKLARIVIDEAHCVSQWGHDFRPDYVALREVLLNFPNVPIMALTATATKNVQVDVMANLGIEGANVYAQSFNRPNLHYEVRSKKEIGTSKAVIEDMVKLIKENYSGQTGIIYTLSRKSCEELAGVLRREHHIDAHHYHAKMDKDERIKVQQKWQCGEWKVIVATIAFGMGIDKPDVRFVIHHTIPKSLEGYYQETGRAGRDGRPSGCYLYYGYGDTAILQQFIHKSEGDEKQKARQRDMLASMIQFSWNRIECRRTQILAYFGESFSKEDCGYNCDNCKSDTVRVEVDFTTYARAAIHIVGKLQDGNVTMLHCVKVLIGDPKEKKIKDMGHDRLPQYGAAKDLSRSQIERLFHRLIAENAFAEENVKTGHGRGRAAFVAKYIKLGSNYAPILNGQRKLRLHELVSASPLAQSTGSRPKAKKAAKKASTSEPYPSTILTSPISGPERRRKKNTFVDDEANEFDGDGFNSLDYARDDFVVSDNEASFERMEAPARGRAKRNNLNTQLGPPITADARMKRIPEVHQDLVHQFVDEAKKAEERIRNSLGLRKPLFTETNFREMAIDWTLTVEEMSKISEINTDTVKRFGSRFIPLITKYHNYYDDIMSKRDDRDVDHNHDNVIDLCDTEETDSDEVEDEVEEHSHHFAKSTGNKDVELFQQAMADARANAPKASRARSPADNGSSRDYAPQAKSKSSYSRKGSGSGTGSFPSRSSGSGVKKRRSTGGSKKASGSKATGGPNKSTWKKSGGGGRSGGGSMGFAAMPT